MCGKKKIFYAFIIPYKPYLHDSGTVTKLTFRNKKPYHPERSEGSIYEMFVFSLKIDVSLRST